MSFQVEWLPAAIEHLMQAAMAAPDVSDSQIVAATSSVDELLSSDPLGRGESASDELKRILIAKPVVVHYRVNSRLRTVEIYFATIYVPRRDQE